MRVYAVGQGRHVGLPVHVLEHAGMLAQNPGAAAQQGAVRLRPRVPPAEDVLPHHVSAAVKERLLHDLTAIERGAVDGAKRKARLQPADGEQAGRRDRAPLQPTAGDRRQRGHRRHALRVEQNGWVGALQVLAEAGLIHGHGVQKHAVGADRRDDAGQRLAVAVPVRLAPGADVPRVVVHEHAHAAVVGAPYQVAQPRQAARHVAVQVELVAAVDPQARIGLPQQHEVVAAELALAIVQDLLDPIAAGNAVVERGVVHEQERFQAGAAVPGQVVALEQSAVELLAQLRPARLQRPRRRRVTSDQRSPIVGPLVKINHHAPSMPRMPRLLHRYAWNGVGNRCRMPQ